MQQDKKSPTQPEDTITKLLGHFGKWQLLVFTMIFLIKISSAWIQFAILFLTPYSTFKCVQFSTNSSLDDDNSKNLTLNEIQFGNVSNVGEISQCYDNCTRYEHDTSPFINTIVSEWDLICDRRWMASFTQMLLQLGVLVGSIIFGFLSDRFGRKKTFLTAVAVILIIGFCIPFSPNYWVFTALRFLLGMGTAGTLVVSFVLIMEVTSPKYREILGCLYHMPYILGHMALPLIAYLFQSWDSYCLALVVPQLIYLMYFVYLPESPKWLVSMGKVEDATKIVKTAAEMNGLPITKIEDTLVKLSAELTSRCNDSQLNYSHLFKSQLLVRTLANCFIWLSTGLMIFGFNQYISQTSTSPYWSTLAAASIQIPANLLNIWLMKRFSRRLAISISFFCAGICVISLGVLPKIFWITTTVSTIGIFFGTLVATSLYVYTSELYPTMARNMGIGAASTFMRVGSMMAPFVSNLSIVWLPTAVIGAMQICGGLVCYWLPETKGKLLPDSMDDLNRDDDKS